MNIVEIEFSTLQKIFDSAINSMNFGSGFLCDEDVEALRECAILLGVDPIIATPYNFKPKYRRLEAERLEGTMESDEAFRKRCIDKHHIYDTNEHNIKQLAYLNALSKDELDIYISFYLASIERLIFWPEKEETK